MLELGHVNKYQVRVSLLAYTVPVMHFTSIFLSPFLVLSSTGTGKKEPGRAQVEWPPCLHAGTMQSHGRPSSSEEHLRLNRPEIVRFRVCRAQTVEEPTSHSTARIFHPRCSPIPGLSHAWTSGFFSRPGGKVAKKLQVQDLQCCVICETRWRHLSRRLQIKRDKATEQGNRTWWTHHSSWVQRTSSDPAQRWE